MASSYALIRRESETRLRSYESRALAATKAKRSGSQGVDVGGALAAGKQAAGSFGQSREQTAAVKGYGTFRQWVYAAVNAIATNLAGQPWAAGELTNAAKKSPGKGPKLAQPWRKQYVSQGLLRKATSEQELEMLESHPILDLMDRPNPLQRKWEFLYMSAANLLLTGVCYWIGGVVQGKKKRGGSGKGGLPTNELGAEIWCVPSTIVKPLHEDGLFSHYKIKTGEAGEGETLEAANVCRIYLPDPSDILGVYAPLASCWRAIKTDEFIQSTQEQLFERGLTPSIALVVGKTANDKRPILTGAQRRSFIRAIREVWDQTVSFGDPAILDGLIEDVKRLDPTAKEMDWTRSGEIVRERIFAAYRVNKYNVGMSENLNRAQVVEARRELARNVINPLADTFSEAATDWAAGMFEQTTKRLWIWIEPQVVADPDQERGEWESARKIGDVSRNEFRAERLGLPPLEDEVQKSTLVETVGGVQGAIAVSTAVGEGKVTPEQAQVIFEQFFGFDSKTAKLMAGEKKEPPPAAAGGPGLPAPQAGPGAPAAPGGPAAAPAPPPEPGPNWWETAGYSGSLALAEREGELLVVRKAAKDGIAAAVEDHYREAAQSGGR
jgi:hypothetical protein